MLVTRNIVFSLVVAVFVYFILNIFFFRSEESRLELYKYENIQNFPPISKEKNPNDVKCDIISTWLNPYVPKIIDICVKRYIDVFFHQLGLKFCIVTPYALDFQHADSSFVNLIPWNKDEVFRELQIIEEEKEIEAFTDLERILITSDILRFYYGRKYSAAIMDIDILWFNIPSFMLKDQKSPWISFRSSSCIIEESPWVHSGLMNISNSFLTNILLKEFSFKKMTLSQANQKIRTITRNVTLFLEQGVFGRKDRMICSEDLICLKYGDNALKIQQQKQNKKNFHHQNLINECSAVHISAKIVHLVHSFPIFQNLFSYFGFNNPSDYTNV